MNHIDILRQFGACAEAIRWFNGRDSKSAWETCERGDWMLWIATRIGVNRNSLVLAACDCAGQAIGSANGDLVGPLVVAIDAAASAAADAADAVAAAATAADAADNAADAYAAASVAANDVADAANNVADVAADAADITDADEARRQSLLLSANLVRLRIPWEIIEQRIVAMEDAKHEGQTATG